ncbi:protocadherin gamma-B7-like, partial [Pundamilia nyererei]|uniref:Protocadherin gamma-B7-like n=1 Tax=Pundamilia nyererei TaxID=303518 RepID=A0A9Y3QWM3_9CICH
MARQVLLFISLLAVGSVLGQVSYTIPEEMTKGSLVGNIAQDLGLQIKRLTSGKARIYARDTDQYVELNRERGVLLVKERIDREALCKQTTPCALHFQIILENPMEFYTVTVQITDINDNAPTFKKTKIIFKISETALIGAKFVLERAVDLDVEMNSVQSYELKPSDNFALKLHSNSDGNKNVEMVLQKPLDREKQEQISLVLTAVDGGEPQMSGTMQILITVLDANDNAPVFTQQTYKATVTENSLKGTIVATVTASDADQGSNSKITYSITNAADDDTRIFEINEENGNVVLIGIIDYEKSRNYQINLLASDDGGLTDSCKLIVDVQDVNDNKPEINIMSKSAVISEDANLNTVVTMINIEDKDSGENGKVQCFMSDNVPFELRASSNNFYTLVTDSDLDRERASEYNITVTCSDEGVPSLSSSVTLTLQITDINDNAPIFKMKDMVFEISESAVKGSKFILEKALDSDVGINGLKSYSLNPTDNFALKLNDNTDGGKEVEMVLEKPLDREKEEQLTLTLTAVDGGEPQLSGTVQIHVTILDANDNAPVFTQSTYKSSLMENSPRGTQLITVTATDKDEGTNGFVTYSISNNIDGIFDLFEIHETSGEVRLIGNVDYETSKHYQLNIKAKDQGGLSDSCKIIFDITDVND